MNRARKGAYRIGEEKTRLRLNFRGGGREKEIERKKDVRGVF